MMPFSRKKLREGDTLSDLLGNWILFLDWEVRTFYTCESFIWKNRDYWAIGSTALLSPTVPVAAKQTHNSLRPEERFAGTPRGCHMEYLAVCFSKGCFSKGCLQSTQVHRAMTTPSHWEGHSLAVTFLKQEGCFAIFFNFSFQSNTFLPLFPHWLVQFFQH